MCVRFLALAVICMLTISAIQAQETHPITAESLLTELGNMLAQTPTTAEGYQAVFEQLRTWQKAKVEELAKAKNKPPITITSPRDQEKVALNPIVRGDVRSGLAQVQVWVIVHPLETEGYWVQPKATVGSDGKWHSLIYIGREGEEDSGKGFEIMAVANPKKRIARGDVLDTWPEAEARSEIVELVRK